MRSREGRQIRVHHTINFTLDLNSGLTQVLSDGSNTYLYGLGRIAQQSASGKEYFLHDALGGWDWGVCRML